MAKTPVWSERGRGRARRALRYLGTVVVTALFIVLFVRKGNFGSAAHLLARANPLYLAPCAALFGLTYLAQAARFQHLVRHLRRVALRDVLPRELLSHTVGQLLPFELDEVLMVQISAEKFGLSRSELYGVESLSRLMDGLVFALFLLLARLTLPIGGAFTALTILMLLGTATGVGLVWWLSRSPLSEEGRPRAVGVAAKVWSGVLHLFLHGLGALRSGREFGAILLFSLLSWTSQAALYALVGLALGIRTNPLVFLFLVSVANIGAGIPLAHAGVGFVLLAQQGFEAAGQPASVATAYALAVETMLVLPVVIIGPLAVWWLHLTWRDLNPFTRSSGVKR